MGRVHPTLFLSTGLALFAAVLHLWSGDGWEMASVLAMVCGGVALGRGDVRRPSTWLALGIGLYAITPRLGLLLAPERGQELLNDFAGRSHEVARVELIGLASACAVASLVESFPANWKSRRRVQNPDEGAARRRSSPALVTIKLLLFAGVGLSALYLLFVIASGATSKPQLAQLGGVGVAAGAGFNALAVATTLLVSRAARRGLRPPLTAIGLVCGWAVVGLLIGGERDHPVRIAVAAGMALAVCYRPPKLRTSVIALVLAVASIGFAAEAKNLLIRDAGTTADRTIADAVLLDEFAAASRNSGSTLRQEWTNAHLGSRVLRWDLIRVVSPPLIAPDNETATSWFNRTFTPDPFRSGIGRGFSLYSEGWLLRGYTGVMIVFAILGAACAGLYRWAHRDPYFVSIYCLAPTYAVYAIRGDLSTFLGPLVWLCIVPILAVRFLDRGAATNSDTSSSPVPLTDVDAHV